MICLGFSLVCTVEVVGSIPIGSTTFLQIFQRLHGLAVPPSASDLNSEHDLVAAARIAPAMGGQRLVVDRGHSWHGTHGSRCPLSSDNRRVDATAEGNDAAVRHRPWRVRV